MKGRELKVNAGSLIAASFECVPLETNYNQKSVGTLRWKCSTAQATEGETKENQKNANNSILQRENEVAQVINYIAK